MSAFAISLLGDQGDSTRRPINVYVVNGSDGFTTPDGGDSSNDLIKSLKHKEKTLRVADTPAGADVTVRVTSRNEEKQISSITTYNKKSENGKREAATTVPNQTPRRIVHATIKAGDFEAELQGEGAIWRIASDNLASQVDHWVKQNYARLIEKRSEANGNDKAAEAVAAPTELASAAPGKHEVSIKPGMTAKQVTESLGEPMKKVNFGQKSLWTYKGSQVVFENGKVTDVKF